MSLSLLAGVTIHGGGRALSYACAGLCERDLQLASNGIDFREIDPPVDEPAAVGADAAQAAGQWAGGGAVRHLLGRYLGRAACDAKNPTRPAGLLGPLPALVQEPRQLPAEDQHRPSIVDGRQPMFEPVANGVLVDVEQPRNVLHRIITVNLHKPRIGMSRAHRLTPDRLPKSTAAAARCALPPIGPARSAHRPDIGLLCGTPARRRSPPAWRAIAASTESHTVP